MKKKQISDTLKLNAGTFSLSGTREEKADQLMKIFEETILEEEKTEVKGLLGTQEYHLESEPDFRANLKFKPDENDVFHATPEFMTHEDSNACFGWWASYGGTLYGPATESRTFVISKEGLSQKEMNFLIEGFSYWGKFREKKETLVWDFKLPVKKVGF